MILKDFLWYVTKACSTHFEGWMSPSMVFNWFVIGLRHLEVKR